jgi:SAM-dependent methyltransferase
MIPRCPVCDVTDLQDCGRPAYRIPALVAGVPIDVEDLDLHHLVCNACTYRFVYPPLPEERLLNCYRGSNDSHWGTSKATRASRNYAHKEALLRQWSPGCRILDFGCYDGGFLASLDQTWKTFGIEPSSAAALVAEQLGISVLGPTVECLRDSTTPFDVVTALDVLEHLVAPRETVRELTRCLRPNGILVVETANTDSSHFRKAGKLDPYCGLVEHVGFFNRRSIKVLADRAGLELVYFEVTAHHHLGRGELVKAHAYRAAYRLIKRVAAHDVPLPRRLAAIAAGPVPRTTEPRDHFIAVLRKR